MDKASLLKKFLNNACNEQEAQLAMQYLQEEPGLLEEILSKSEWDEIDSSIPLMPELEKEVKRRIYRGIRKPVYKVLRPVLAYAAILAAVFFGLMYFKDTGKVHNDKTISATGIKSLSTIKFENNSTRIKVLILSDNSSVHLYPGSYIIYEKAFVANRKINLSGKAIFNVTKNSESPFVVRSGEVSTTALGTKFLVDNSNEVTKVNVKLFEGRVVVQPIDLKSLIQKTYLEAGQQCFVDFNTSMVKVESLYRSQHLAQNKKSVINKNNIISNNEGAVLEFSKMPMPQVLNNLEEVFGRKIYFNKNEIDENLLTGTFSVKDSLMNILHMIAVMNDLQIEMKGDSVSVSKQIQNLQQDKEAAVYDQRKVVSGTALQPKIALPEMNSISAFEANTVLQQNNSIVVSENGVRFTGISLPDLFAELQKHTKRKIYFNEEDLKHINFTGSIPNKTSIGSTLTAICQSIGLKLTVKNRSYYVSRVE